jgi:hypothetical protein
MELQDQFDKIFNHIYSINDISNNCSDNTFFEEDETFSKFMENEGKKAANYLLNEEFSLENISSQNNIIKKGGKSDHSEEYIYAIVEKILLKNDTGYFTKREYNFIALAHFTIGVDDYLKNHVVLFNYF